MSNKIYKLFSPIITGYFNRTFYDIAKLAQEVVFIIYIYLSVYALEGPDYFPSFDIS